MGSLNHHNVADTFIVCGVIYAVDHVERSSTRIRFALDLYRNKLLDVELPFSNPFSYTTALGYNPRLKSLTTWDSGNQVTVLKVTKILMLLIILKKILQTFEMHITIQK